MKKYELIPEGKLFRIIALKDFGFIKKGELGGLIEKESNLSQKNECWVYKYAKVYGNASVTGNASITGNAKVTGNAEVYGNAYVSGNAKATKEVITFGNIFDYDITITDNHIKIGCQQYLKSRWLEFTNKEILEMGGKRALKFWGLFKPFAINMGFFN